MNIFDLFKKIEKNESRAPITHIVAGLGNPGAEYKSTRHNVGFMALDYIADKLGVRIDRAKFHSLITEAELGGVRVLLMKPETYMNNSGVAISEAASFYKIAPENIIVLHDEISFEPGNMRIRRKGSAGGHNGLKSIIAHVGSEDFPRIKIGVGKKPSPEYDLAAWVLAKMPESDLDSVKTLFPSIYSSVEHMLRGEIEAAMSKYSK
jgi:PTH1 family peptidyl-tRNA hydrolase